MWNHIQRNNWVTTHHHHPQFAIQRKKGLLWRFLLPTTTATWNRQVEPCLTMVVWVISHLPPSDPPNPMTN